MATVTCAVAVLLLYQPLQLPLVLALPLALVLGSRSSSPLRSLCTGDALYEAPEKLEHWLCKLSRACVGPCFGVSVGIAIGTDAGLGGRPALNEAQSDTGDCRGQLRCRVFRDRARARARRAREYSPEARRVLLVRGGAAFRVVVSNP